MLGVVISGFGLALGCASAPLPVVPASIAVDPEPPAEAKSPVPSDAADVQVSPTPPVVAESLRTARRALRTHGHRVDPLAQEAIAQLLYRTELRDGIPVTTVLGLIQQESRFDPRARGPRGSLGLMQIRPFVARDVARRHEFPWDGAETLYDPVANVRIGLAYLVEQRERFGSVEHALAAYNVGPSRLKRLLAAGRSGKGRYVRRVLQKADALAVEFQEAETAAGG
jgi:soluble lytic murein transglycosylase-like protein